MTTYELPPDTDLFSALRDFGYSPEAAIADIVDNSLSANSHTIDIQINWDNQYPYISITDDGDGMDKNTLLNAMKLASTYSNKNRKSDDLGRFGLGLKSAGLSLGSQLTVITANGSEITDATWDINRLKNNPDKKWTVYVNEDDEDIRSYRVKLAESKKGTVILIRDLDKFVIGNDIDEAKGIFYKTINKIQKHLELVFHRFIYEDDVKISINNNKPLEPWDPFLSNWPENLAAYRAVDEFDENRIRGRNGEIKIQSFILPHKSKFESIDGGIYSHKSAGGPYGWSANQGFYIYRNRRLIMHGTWLGLIDKEKFYDLARIKVDILSTHDNEWKINIDKTKATPPVDVRKKLKQIAEACAKRSMEVYNSRASSSRGKTRPSLAAAWEQRRVGTGNYTYKLNKKHPLYLELINTMSPETKEIFKSYIEIIENYSPVMQMGLSHISENGVDVPNDRKLSDISRIKKMIKGFRLGNCDDDEIKQTILDMPDFSYLKYEYDAIFKEAIDD